MINTNRLSKFLIALLILVGFLQTSESRSAFASCELLSESHLDLNSNPVLKGSKSSKEVDNLNMLLKGLLTNKNYKGCSLIVDSIFKKISKNLINEKTRSDSYYFIGIYYSYTKHLDKALEYLKSALLLREKIQEFDYRYARTLYNLGILYSRLGDFKEHEDYSIKSLEIEKKIFGERSPSLIDTYSSLVTASILLQEYDKAVNY